MDFGLFYFANDGGSERQGYRVLLEGAKFADANGFSAVWTPERHFHEFGGLYPNAAVTGAAVAAVTTRVAIRAGSVVAPLHHPMRIAEEWSVVDNLSGGRVGVSLASGWHTTDFALRPENYARRKEVVVSTLDTIQRLWRRERITIPDGRGDPVTIGSFPAPVQRELPVWLTSAGSPDTFRLAGELGVGVLTHILGQSFDELGRKIQLYRDQHRRRHGTEGHVVLMMHTFMGEDRQAARETVRRPFCDYLRSSMGLVLTAAGDLLPDLDPDDLDPDDLDFLVEHAFDRYFETGGLFGTAEDASRVVHTAAETGVDEIACLVDFVTDVDAVLAALPHLKTLKDQWSGNVTSAEAAAACHVHAAERA